MKPMLGGMSQARLLADMIRAREKELGYPSFIITGYIVFPSAATLACVDPDKAPNMAQDIEVIIVEPPCKCPRNDLTKSINLDIDFPDAIRSPAKINIGIHTSEAGLMPLNICCTIKVKFMSGKKINIVIIHVPIKITKKGNPNNSNENAIPAIVDNINYLLLANY